MAGALSGVNGASIAAAAGAPAMARLARTVPTRFESTAPTHRPNRMNPRGAGLSRMCLVEAKLAGAALSCLNRLAHAPTPIMAAPDTAVANHAATCPCRNAQPRNGPATANPIDAKYAAERGSMRFALSQPSTPHPTSAARIGSSDPGSFSKYRLG